MKGTINVLFLMEIFFICKTDQDFKLNHKCLIRLHDLEFAFIKVLSSSNVDVKVLKFIYLHYGHEFMRKDSINCSVTCGFDVSTAAWRLSYPFENHLNHIRPECFIHKLISQKKINHWVNFLCWFKLTIYEQLSFKAMLCKVSVCSFGRKWRNG